MSPSRFRNLRHKAYLLLFCCVVAAYAYWILTYVSSEDGLSDTCTCLQQNDRPGIWQATVHTTEGTSAGEKPVAEMRLESEPIGTIHRFPSDFTLRCVRKQGDTEFLAEPARTLAEGRDTRGLTQRITLRGMVSVFVHRSFFGVPTTHATRCRVGCEATLVQVEGGWKLVALRDASDDILPSEERRKHELYNSISSYIVPPDALPDEAPPTANERLYSGKFRLTDGTGFEIPVAFRCRCDLDALHRDITEGTHRMRTETAAYFTPTNDFPDESSAFRLIPGSELFTHPLFPLRGLFLDCDHYEVNPESGKLERLVLSVLIQVKRTKDMTRTEKALFHDILTTAAETNKNLLSVAAFYKGSELSDSPRHLLSNVYLSFRINEDNTLTLEHECCMEGDFYYADKELNEVQALDHRHLPHLSGKDIRILPAE